MHRFGHWRGPIFCLPYWLIIDLFHHFTSLIESSRKRERIITSFMLYEFRIGNKKMNSLILGEFSFLSSLYILVIRPLSDLYLENIFSHYVSGLFSLKTISFVVQKLFNFMKSHLSIFSLSYWAAGVLLRKSLPIPITSGVFPALSCTNFRISGMILRSLIHVELILVQGDSYGSSFRFLQADSHFSQQHLLRRLSIFPHMFLAPLSKIRWA
jgi:hypothetical protein